MIRTIVTVILAGMTLATCGGNLAPAFGRNWQSAQALDDPYEELSDPAFWDTDQVRACCGPADAYIADDFDRDGDDWVAIVTDNRAVPNRINRDGQRIVVPADKIKTDPVNRTGHGIIFLGSGQPPYIYCYFPPGGV